MLLCSFIAAYMTSYGQLQRDEHNGHRRCHVCGTLRTRSQPFPFPCVYFVVIFFCSSLFPSRFACRTHIVSPCQHRRVFVLNICLQRECSLIWSASSFLRFSSDPVPADRSCLTSPCRWLFQFSRRAKAGFATMRAWRSWPCWGNEE